MSKLYAISDLHLFHAENRRALKDLRVYPNDWLIVAGDVGETVDHLRFALAILTERFAQVLWVPGNHDLWTLPSDQSGLRGVHKYEELVSLCRGFGVLTPEDPYACWSTNGRQYRLAPLFLLYDYSFRPAEIPAEKALEWAEESGVLCTDEVLLHPDPYPSRAAWCAARCRTTEQRLMQLGHDQPLILINHFPLREDLFELKKIPRFSLWCGTRRTESWHTKFHVEAVVYGHLHIRGSQIRDGVRFEEVSFGYPRNWSEGKRIDDYLRQILPVPDMT